jgi:O-antigen ligase
MFTTDSSIVQGSSGDTEAVVGSNRSRIRMIETGWRMFRDYPVCGTGDGEMHAMYREYVPDAIKDEGGHLHNTYVHVLATHGAIGFSAMLALFFGMARMFWSTWKRNKLRDAGIVALGAMAAFAGFLVNGFAEYNFGDHEIVLILWLITGLVSASAETAKAPAEARARV